MSIVHIVSFLCRDCESAHREGFSVRQDAEAFAARAENVRWFSDVKITAQERAFSTRHGLDGRMYPDLVHRHAERVALKAAP